MLINGKQQKIIGIVAAAIQKEHINEVAMAVADEAIKRGYKVLVYATFYDLFHGNVFSVGESSVFKLMISDIPDALVLLPESIKNPDAFGEILADAKKLGIPLVCVDREVEGVNSVTFDYTGAFEKIVRHVVEDHGCRRVNFIAGIKGNAFSEERVECYKKVLAENGIEFEEDRLGYGDFWDLPTLKVMDRFMSSGLDFPEAIVCCNDVAAITACRYLKEHGVSVPEDVIVTGFDGIELERYTVPRLTTASVDIKAMCVSVLDMIENEMAGEQEVKLCRIPYKMRVSQSCGCRKVHSEEVTDKIMELYEKMKDSEGHEDHMFAYLFHTVDITDTESLARLMPRYADSHTWCCVNKDFTSTEREAHRYNTFFTETMNMMMHCCNGELTMNVDFSASQLLPEFDKVLQRHDIIMLLPMHFQDEIMGYYAVSINTKNFNFSNTRRFINDSNQIFETLKNRILLQRTYSEMAEMHLRDPMTGIYNRRGFYKNVDKFPEGKENKQFILFSADLDGLKTINDNYGHDMGDIAIAETARVLCTYDTDAICARFGGDEFVVLAAAQDKDKYIKDYLEDIDHKLEEYNCESGLPFEISVSIGCGYPESMESDELSRAFKESDTDMYERKRKKHLSGK